MPKNHSHSVPCEIQQELVYLLRRIENDIDSGMNIERLWKYCARHQIDWDALLLLLRGAMLDPERILKILSQSETTKENISNEKKICVITCVNNERKYEECLLYLQHSNLPKGFVIEYTPIYNAKCLTAGYQAGMISSHAKYKVYIHQDACLINKNALCRMIEMFQANPKIGMFGVAGCTKLPSNGVWFETEGIGYGVVAQATAPDTLKRLGYAKTHRDYELVEAIDGVFMMTQYDIPWRADIFTGWHFYDISQSMEFRKRGWKLAIPGSDTIWCIHDSDIEYDINAYEHWRKTFVNIYKDML